MKFKKADGGLTAIVIIVIILFFVGWLVTVSQQECSSNKHCGNNEYCGADNACHPFPVQKETTTVVQREGFLLPAVILALGLVVSAWILRRRDQPKEELPEHKLDSTSFEKYGQDLESDHH